MPLMDSLRRNDDGMLTKGLVAVAVVGVGVGALVAVRRWQQSHQCPAASSATDGHEALKDKKSEPSKESTAPKATNVPPPSTTVTGSVVKPAQPSPAAAPPPPAVTPKEPPKPPAAVSAKDPSVVVPPAAAAAAPAVVPPKVVPPAAPAAAQPPPPASKSPRSSGSDNNGGELSTSSTFEKVSADGNSLPPVSTATLHDVAKTQHATPPLSSTGGGAASGVAKPLSMGGAKSLSGEESMFDSSIETPVFGGQPYSMLPDVEIESSTFNPATEHPAFFGFKFEGPSS